MRWRVVAALLLILSGPALAEPRAVGTVRVNGVATGARYFQEGRHLYYPIVAIASGLHRKAAYGAGRLVVDGRSVGVALRDIDGAAYATWPSVHRLFPELQYGIRDGVAFFDSRPSALAVLPRSASPVASPSSVSSVQEAILDELNLARTDPARYAGYLEEMRRRFQGSHYVLPNGTHILTQEGTRAVDEAIAFLRRQAPLSPLRFSAGLALGARDHVRDQGPKGTTGHEGSDGSHPSDRVERYGAWERTMGECISYGMSGAREIVIQLIVDDGVPDRGHRTNIFTPGFRVVGIAVGPHDKYRTMCVMDFAGGFREAAGR
jgi:uncharacterized protein YkwD